MLEYGTNELGFNVAFFILGMAGGFVRSITKDHVTIKTGLVNIVVGGILACYFTPIIIHHSTIKAKESVFATALALGFCAMGIFTIYDHIEDWAQRNPRFFITQFANWLAATAKHLGAKLPNNGNDKYNGGSDTEPDPEP